MDQSQPHDATEGVLHRPITGIPDLQHLSHDVRGFLPDVTDHVVADAALVVVMLVGDAHRYGAPPVTLRIRRDTQGTRLRVEVDDHRPPGTGTGPEDYRAHLLDRMTTARGVQEAGGVTTTWADIRLTPKRPEPTREWMPGRLSWRMSDRLPDCVLMAAVSAEDPLPRRLRTPAFAGSSADRARPSNTWT